MANGNIEIDCALGIDRRMRRCGLGGRSHLSPLVSLTEQPRHLSLPALRNFHSKKFELYPSQTYPLACLCHKVFSVASFHQFGKLPSD